MIQTAAAAGEPHRAISKEAQIRAAGCRSTAAGAAGQGRSDASSMMRLISSTPAWTRSNRRARCSTIKKPRANIVFVGRGVGLKFARPGEERAKQQLIVEQDDDEHDQHRVADCGEVALH